MSLPKRSRVGKSEKEILQGAVADPALRTEQQRVVTGLFATTAQQRTDLDAPFICYHCGCFGTVLDYRSVVEFRTIGNLRCVVQGAKYFYLYYVRACAPSKETLLKRTEAKQNVHGMALTEEEAKKAKSGIAAWPVNVLTSCQAGPRCGAQCWKPLCRECFNAYYESHQDAERFMVGGSMSGTLVDATRRCAFTYGNGEACDDVPAPTCNGFCFRHREHGGLVLLPTHAEVVQTILEKTPKNVPAAIAGLICDFAAPFKQ